VVTDVCVRCVWGDLSLWSYEDVRLISGWEDAGKGAVSYGERDRAKLRAARSLNERYPNLLVLGGAASVSRPSVSV